MAGRKLLLVLQVCVGVFVFSLALLFIAVNLDHAFHLMARGAACQQVTR